jgi:hypothetical protein
MDLFHELCKVGRGVVLVNGFIEGGESVFNGAWPFDGEQRIDGMLSSRETVNLDLLESGNVRLSGPHCGLRYFDALSGKDSTEKERETEKDGQPYHKQHEETSRELSK